MRPPLSESPRPRLQRDPLHDTYPQLRIDPTWKSEGDVHLLTRPLLSTDTRDDDEASVAAALAVAFTRRRMGSRGSHPWGPQPCEGAAVSRRFLQHHMQTLKGDAANKTPVRILDAIKALQRYGVCTEETWPCGGGSVHTKPSAEAYAEARGHEIDLTFTVAVDLQAMRYCLSQGHAFVFILDIDPTAFLTEGVDGCVQRPPPGAALSSHVMCCLGYDETSFRVLHALGATDREKGAICSISNAWMTDPTACSDVWMLRRSSDLDLGADAQDFPSRAERSGVSVVPSIKVKGVERVLSPTPVTPYDRPMPSGAVPTRPLPEPPPAASLLRHTCPPIEQQGALLSCGAHAFTSALEYLSLRDGVHEPLSRLFLHWAARDLYGHTDSDDTGTRIGNLVMALASLGVCSERLWPYDETKLRERPSQEALDDAATRMHLGAVQLPTLRAIKLSLASGYPVVVGFGVSSAADDAPDGTSSETHKTGSFPLPTAESPSTGSHFALAIGYDDARQKVFIANSWGEDWGDGGYGDLGYEFFGPTQDTPLADKNVSGGDAWTVRTPADIAEMLAPAPSLVVHGPRGVRVEGASVGDVAALFQKLA